MTIKDDLSTSPAPAPPPPSYVRRHPILSAFGILSGLSLFSALWPVSAIVVGVAVAGHATGADRAVLHIAERLAARIASSMHHAAHHVPGPVAPAPTAPQPSAPEPSAPRREVHAPAAPAARSHRAPHPRTPGSHRHEPARRPRTWSTKSARPPTGRGSEPRVRSPQPGACLAKPLQRFLGAEKHHGFDHGQSGRSAEDRDVQDAKRIPGLGARLFSHGTQPLNQGIVISRPPASMASMAASSIAAAVALSTFFGGNSTPSSSLISPRAGRRGVWRRPG